MQKMLVSNESFKIASPFFSLKVFLYMVCWDAKNTIITSIFRTCLNFKTISQSGQILFYKRLLIYHKQVFTLPNSYWNNLAHHWRKFERAPSNPSTEALKKHSKRGHCGTESQIITPKSKGNCILGLVHRQVFVAKRNTTA